MLARYSVKAEGSASTTNKTPASVKTAVSALRQAYARVHGDKPDDFGDLTWLTLANLKKAVSVRDGTPAVRGSAAPWRDRGDVSAPRARHGAVLYAASKHLLTVGIEQSERTRLSEAYNAAYMDFGRLSGELMEAEQNRLATREPSQR